MCSLPRNHLHDRMSFMTVTCRGKQLVDRMWNSASLAESGTVTYANALSGAMFVAKRIPDKVRPLFDSQIQEVISTLRAAVLAEGQSGTAEAQGFSTLHG